MQKWSNWYGDGLHACHCPDNPFHQWHIQLSQTTLLPLSGHTVCLTEISKKLKVLVAFFRQQKSMIQIKDLHWKRDGCSYLHFHCICICIWNQVYFMHIITQMELPCTERGPVAHRGCPWPHHPPFICDIQLNWFLSTIQIDLNSILKESSCHIKSFLSFLSAMRLWNFSQVQLVSVSLS